MTVSGGPSLRQARTMPMKMVPVNTNTQGLFFMLFSSVEYDQDTIYSVASIQMGLDQARLPFVWVTRT